MGDPRTPTSVRRLRRTLLGMLLTAGLLAGLSAPAGASDVDLGDPQTLEELLASPEYLDDEHADVARLYQAFFNREPDVGGLSYWIDVYEDGTSLEDLAWAFSNSTEFRQAYGTDLTNGQFLEIVYANVLGRGYDQGGFDYWLDQMNQGLSRHEAVFWIVAGQEFINNYPFLGTAPDTTSALAEPISVQSLRPDISETDRMGRDKWLTESDILGLSTCQQMRYLHSNEYRVLSYSPDYEHFLAQEHYAFSNVADAERVVQNHRDLPTRCGYQDNGFSVEQWWARSDSEFTSGDEHVILEYRYTMSDGTNFDAHFIVVRDEHTVTVTIIMHNGYGSDYVTAATIARDTSARIQALLGE